MLLLDIAGVNPALAIGTEVRYGCPDSMVFSNDWYMTPLIRIHCLETGVFDKPDNWPMCIERELN